MFISLLPHLCSLCVIKLFCCCSCCMRFDGMLALFFDDCIENQNDHDNNRGSLSVLVFVICNYFEFLYSFFCFSVVFVGVVVTVVVLMKPSSSLIILNSGWWAAGYFELNFNCQMRLVLVFSWVKEPSSLPISQSILKQRVFSIK